MTAGDDWQAAEHERSAQVEAAMGRIRADWRPLLGMMIAAPDHATLLEWIAQRYALNREQAEIALDQKFSVLVPLARPNGYQTP